LIGISSDEYPTIAKRPASSRLDTQKWRNQTGKPTLIDWQEAFEPVLRELLSARF
jgi:dTDP-4-dehydrorhamnose reductase